LFYGLAFFSWDSQKEYGKTQTLHTACKGDNSLCVPVLRVQPWRAEQRGHRQAQLGSFRRMCRTQYAGEPYCPEPTV